jgi:hypothetical protein
MNIITAPGMTPLLAAALVKAQAEVQSAARNEINPEKGYSFASADEIVSVAKAALTTAKLALVPTGSTLVEVEGPPGRRTDLVRRWWIVHESGAYLDVPAVMPVCWVRGEPDKSVAACDTFSLAYQLRDLLCIPRRMVGETEVDKRPPASRVEDDPVALEDMRRAERQAKRRDDPAAVAQAEKDAQDATEGGAVVARPTGRSTKASRATAALADSMSDVPVTVELGDVEREEEERQAKRAADLAAEPSSLPPVKDPDWYEDAPKAQAHPLPVQGRKDEPRPYVPMAPVPATLANGVSVFVCGYDRDGNMLVEEQGTKAKRWVSPGEWPNDARADSSRTGMHLAVARPDQPASPPVATPSGSMDGDEGEVTPDSSSTSTSGAIPSTAEATPSPAAEATAHQPPSVPPSPSSPSGEPSDEGRPTGAPAGGESGAVSEPPAAGTAPAAGAPPARRNLLIEIAEEVCADLGAPLTDEERAAFAFAEGEAPDAWRSRVSPEVAARYDALDAAERDADLARLRVMSEDERNAWLDESDSADEAGRRARLLQEVADEERAELARIVAERAEPRSRCAECDAPLAADSEQCPDPECPTNARPQVGPAPDWMRDTPVEEATDEEFREAMARGMDEILTRDGDPGRVLNAPSEEQVNVVSNVATAAVSIEALQATAKDLLARFKKAHRAKDDKGTCLLCGERIEGGDFYRGPRFGAAHEDCITEVQAGRDPKCDDLFEEGAEAPESEVTT